MRNRLAYHVIIQKDMALEGVPGMDRNEEQLLKIHE